MLLYPRYTALVTNGDFALAEQRLLAAMQGEVLSDYLSKFKYTPEWTLIKPMREDGAPQDKADMPGMRGGHQMCIDSEAGFIYLFGGWDGKWDLGDLWR